MTSRTVSLCDVRRMSRRGCAALLVLLTSLVTLGQAVPAIAADEPDLIFRRSTVFKWVSPNDKLEIGRAHV